MIQFNSEYVNGGQTVVTLFMEEDGKMTYIIDQIPEDKHHTKVLSEVAPQNLQKEAFCKSEKVWGSKDLFVPKRFVPLSKELREFILNCWVEICTKEMSLFKNC